MRVGFVPPAFVFSFFAGQSSPFPDFWLHSVCCTLSVEFGTRMSTKRNGYVEDWGAIFGSFFLFFATWNPLYHILTLIF